MTYVDSVAAPILGGAAIAAAIIAIYAFVKAAIIIFS